MSSPLYVAKIVEKSGNVVRVALRIAHPDIRELGTDRHFAWLVLSDWVSPDDDEADSVVLANKYVRRVDLSPLEDGTIERTAPSYIVVNRVDPAVGPGLVYAIEVSDAALLAQVEVGASDDIYESVSDAFLPNPHDGENRAQNGEPTRRLELVDGGSNKFWQVRQVGDELHIAWGKLGTVGQSQIKSFPSAERASGELHKLVVEKTKKGYAEVSPSPLATDAAIETPQEAAPKKPKAPAAKKTKAPESAPPATMEDFRAAAFALVANDPPNHPSDLIDRLAEWAHELDDTASMGWVERLGQANAERCSAAARLAVIRARAGQIEQAKRFLALAEAELPTDAHGLGLARVELVPAWWLLGKTAEADAAYEAHEAFLIARSTMPNQREHQLASMAALGRRYDLFEAHLAHCLVGNDYRGDLLVPGLVALDEDGENERVERVLSTWTALNGSGHYQLVPTLLPSAMRRGVADRFLALSSKYKILRDSHATIAALRSLEQRDPDRAVAAAQGVLNDSVYGELQAAYAIATLRRHAPDEAARWATSETATKWLAGPSRLAMLSALGRDAEVRAALAADPSLIRHAPAAPTLTSNRALAIELATALVDVFGLRDPIEWALIPLVRLGERTLVDAKLEALLAGVGALAPKDRDIDCRELGRISARLGRFDIGVAASALPTKTLRRLTIAAMVKGGAQAGDWSIALAALRRDTDQEARGSALQNGLATYARRYAEAMREPRCLDG